MGFFTFWGESVLNFKLNAFFFTFTEYSQNDKRKKSNNFLKERTNHSQLLAKQREKLKTST